MQRNRLAPLALLALLGAIGPLLLGLGSSGGRDVNRPAVDFQAKLVDKDGTTVELSRVNIGGDVQLEGEVGRGRLRIPFDNIASVEFSGESRDHGRATVHLKSGEAITLRVRNSLMIYGHTSAGIYQIRARDLRSIQFKS